MTSTEPITTEINEESKESVHPLTICTIGKTGNGKSTILNRFFGDKSKKGNRGAFEAKLSLNSVTMDVTSKTQRLKYDNPSLEQYNDLICKLIDTPGLADTTGRDHEIIEQIKKFFKSTCDGVHVFLIVMKVIDVRFDQNLQDVLHILHNLFGDKFWKHVMLVFTFHDFDSDGECDTIEEYSLVKNEYPKKLKELYQFENDLIVTAFGKGNFVSGIKDIIEFGLKQGLYTCHFMSNWNISRDKQKLMHKNEKLKIKNENLKEYLESLKFNLYKSEQRFRHQRKENELLLHEKKRKESDISCVIL